MTYTRKNKGVCSLSTEVTLTDDGVTYASHMTVKD